MKTRLLGVALVCFILGAVAYRVVETRTSWLRVLQAPTTYHVVDTNAMNWVESGKDGPSQYFMKFLNKDVNAKQTAMLVRYPAGQVQPEHVHTHGHGMYVLSGKLVTNRGTYGPGTFVWSPANEVVSHGASTDEDAVVLFLRHEDMETRYLNAPTH